MAGSVWPTLIAGARAKASEVESKFDWVEQDLVPMLGGTKADATYDLGQSAFRWRDGYFSRQMLGPAGSVTVPPFSRQSGANTGVYFPSATEVALTANGAEVVRASVAQLKAVNGSVTAPSYSWLNSTQMGWYRIGSNNLGGTVAGVKFWDVSAAGEILAPLQPLFFAQLSSTVSNVTGNNTNYTLTCAEELIDNNSDYDTSNGKFTAPITGRYFFQAHIDFSILNTTTSNTMTLLQVQFYKNGVSNVGSDLYFNGSLTSSVLAVSPSLHLYSVYSLTSGDTVYLVAFGNFRGSNNVGIQGGNGTTHFTGGLLG